MLFLMLRILRLKNPSGPVDRVTADLVAACARNRDDSPMWTEFLRRYGGKIKLFIRGTLRTAGEGSRSDGPLPGGPEEKDLFQSTILKLVENDCAALKRFTGLTEDEWLAYLAVITRSVVRDALRRRNRYKRMGNPNAVPIMVSEAATPEFRPDRPERLKMERELLASEVRSLCEQQIQSEWPESCARNLLIFRLYFDHDLTTRQIAACRGVNLSKTGVEKVINRLKERVRTALSPDTTEAMMG
jgi:RNA polymerase sigma factor (sigma-70 family)